MSNDHQPSYETMSEAISALQNMGYIHDFNLDTDCIRYENGQKALRPEEFHIDKVYRFEGITDPGDENVVYAITSPDQAVKGLLVSAFGTYSDPLSDDMVKKLSIH